MDEGIKRLGGVTDINLIGGDLWKKWGMQNHPTVFSQVTATLYASEFARCTQAYPTLRPTRGLTEYDQFLALVFGQLTGRESLRDVVACLNAKAQGLYHLGFRGYLSRTNLAYANRHRDWRLFAAVAQILMRRAARLYRQERADAESSQVAFALDASIIRLSLSLFPWGYWARTRQAALKLHLLLSLKGNVPAWGAITEPDFFDARMMDQIPIQAGAFYIMDRAYIDFIRLYRFEQNQAYFVVRCKGQIRFSVQTSQSVNQDAGLCYDQTVRLTSPWSKKSFPAPLRRVCVESQPSTPLVLLTNNFELSALDIGRLYRQRWQVELFFKWVKQHLRLRGFYGRSPNAVRCQIWAAISAYLMVAIVRKQLGLKKSLYEILQIVSVNAFAQVPLAQLLEESSPLNQNLDLQKPLMLNP
jgi:hypothetical protein